MSNSTLLSNPFWRTLLERRSIRRTSAEPIPRAVLERLLTAAIWAPSAHNRQPWRFVVVTRGSDKRQLAEGMGRRWETDLVDAGVDAETARSHSERSRARIMRAGATVVACLNRKELERFPDERRQHLEWQMGVQSVALALQNLLLAAQHEGLGACWLCAPLFAPDEVRAALALPADWEPQALITLGYPTETRTSTRKPLEEVVVWR